MNIWIPDPKTKESSVSLTLLALATFLFVVSMGLQMFEVVKEISAMLEFWVGAVSLYFGRKFQVGKASAGSSEEPAVDNPDAGESK